MIVIRDLHDEYCVCFGSFSLLAANARLIQRKIIFNFIGRNHLLIICTLSRVRYSTVRNERNVNYVIASYHSIFNKTEYKKVRIITASLSNSCASHQQPNGTSMSRRKKTLSKYLVLAERPYDCHYNSTLPLMAQYIGRKLRDNVNMV